MPELRIPKKPAAKPLTYGDCVGQVIKEGAHPALVISGRRDTKCVTRVWLIPPFDWADIFATTQMSGELLGPIEIVEVEAGEPQSVTECNRVTDADRKRAGELADKVDVPGWYLREVKEAAALLRKFASATPPAVPLPGEIARMVKWLRDPNKPQFSMEHHLRDAADMIEALHAGASKDAEAKP